MQLLGSVVAEVTWLWPGKGEKDGGHSGSWLLFLKLGCKGAGGATGGSDTDSEGCWILSFFSFGLRQRETEYAHRQLLCAL